MPQVKRTQIKGISYSAYRTKIPKKILSLKCSKHFVPTLEPYVGFGEDLCS